MGIVAKRRKKKDGQESVEYIFVKRVPKRFQHVDPRPDRRISLRTDSLAEARRKAPAVEAEMLAHWEDLAAGRSDDAAARYQAAKALAEARGFSYVHHADLASIPIDDLIARLQAAAAAGDPVVTDALLGEADPPSVTLSAAMADFFDLTTDRLAGKSEGLVRRWRLPRERSVRNLIEALDRDPPIDQITREDALTFRRWWRDRIDTEDKDPGTANKDFGHLSDMFRTWCELRGRDLDNPFARMRFKKTATAERHPFSTAWIKDRLLAPGALDGLNQAARDVFLVMVNTGARPSEIINADPRSFVLDHAVPHIKIQPENGRALKTLHSARDLPLIGVSLEAARRLVEAGGCTKYRDKANGWSATVNKYLTENGLRETTQHTAYSLRHAFEDRLLESGVDERLRVELMGHKYGRPKYGRGGSLELKRAAVALVEM